jgi:2-succinyl-6-hydroxy-2,4-cyclohexadiene-1-carboxylate synthase
LEKYRIELVDLPGHGESTARPSTLDEAGRLAAEVSIGSVLIGYSMGARVALHAALQPHHQLKGLVLIGAHPGIVDETERQIRRDADQALAQRIEEIGVETFLDEWLKQPMFDGVRDLNNRDRLRNSADGLAYALRTLGTGNQRVLDAELGALRLPVLVITGDRDQKFLDLTSRFRSCLQDATFATIANAGHACHLEQPDATRETIEGWLEKLRESDADRQ